MDSTQAIDRRSVGVALCGPALALVAGTVLLFVGADESVRLLGGYAGVISITGFAVVASNVRDAVLISRFLDHQATPGAVTHHAPPAAPSWHPRQLGAPLSAEPQVFRPDWWSRVFRPAAELVVAVVMIGLAVLLILAGDADGSHTVPVALFGLIGAGALGAAAWLLFRGQRRIVVTANELRLQGTHFSHVVHWQVIRQVGVDCQATTPVSLTILFAAGEGATRFRIRPARRQLDDLTNALRAHVDASAVPLHGSLGLASDRRASRRRSSGR
ncbi:MAG: hypothetical protein M3Y35_14755 [Actinomycetota bacterium]|nr:hypothetical protein [Actinomycetota bacterium]